MVIILLIINYFMNKKFMLASLPFLLAILASLLYSFNAMAFVNAEEMYYYNEAQKAIERGEQPPQEIEMVNLEYKADNQ